MSHEFLDFVEDILDGMNKAEELLEGVSYTQFENDYRVNFAVVRALEIIGEATKRLPEELRQRYPDIPWKGMAGMRDRIIMVTTMSISSSCGMSSSATFLRSNQKLNGY